MTHSTIAERLATFAAELDVDALPDTVRERAKACLIHAMVVGIAGGAADFGRHAEQTSDGSIEQPAAGGYARSLVTGHWHPAAAAATGPNTAVARNGGGVSSVSGADSAMPTS